MDTISASNGGRPGPRPTRPSARHVEWLTRLSQGSGLFGRADWKVARSATYEPRAKKSPGNVFGQSNGQSTLLGGRCRGRVRTVCTRVGMKPFSAFICGCGRCVGRPVRRDSTETVRFGELRTVRMLELVPRMSQSEVRCMFNYCSSIPRRFASHSRDQDHSFPAATFVPPGRDSIG